jgi:hypothetical protein
LTHPQVAILREIGFNEKMLQINPRKFKPIKNKTIPNPMRPKFRNKAQSNIYFLSQRKVSGERKTLFIYRAKMIIILAFVLVVGYILSN